MGKYLHLFETESAFNTAYNGEAYEEPWVSYTEEVEGQEHVDYNKACISAIPVVDHNGTELGTIIPYNNCNEIRIYGDDFYGDYSRDYFFIKKKYVKSFAFDSEYGYQCIEDGDYYHFIPAGSGWHGTTITIILAGNPDTKIEYIY